MYLAGIDLGTTGCKSMVFDLAGNIAGSHYIEYDLIFTPEGVEQDAELWWEHAKTALKKAVEAAGIPAGEIKAIAAASQGIASVPVDVDGRPLARAISWYDNRAEAVAREIAAHYGDRQLFETTGRHAGSFLFPQILHIKRKNPALYERARYFLMAQDYIVYRLCGRAVTDYTMASGTLCFDTGKAVWLDEMFSRYGVDLAKFPALKPFGSAAGTVLPSVARELGLSEDTVVGVGLQDQKAAALGAGIVTGAPHGSAGSVMTLSIGTASAIIQLVPEKFVDKSGRLNCHAFDGKHWVLENYVGASGSSLKWLRGALFPGKSYAELDGMAAKSAAGSGGVFFVPALDEKDGVFSGLSLSTTAGDMVRAALEGVAFGVRRCVEIQKEASGNNAVKELRVFGGGSGSALWCQILADILGMPVVLPRTAETSNMGAAVCAGMAIGLFRDNTALAEFIGTGRKRFEPDPAGARVYNEAYPKYLALTLQN